MSTRRIAILAAILILGAPVIGYLLYSRPALEGMYLRWILPLSMVVFGLLLVLAAFGPDKPQIQPEVGAGSDGDGKQAAIDREVS